MNKEKIDKSFLVFNPIIFVERELYRSKNKLFMFRYLFILLNIITLVAAFFVASLTTIVFSKIAWAIGDWFYYTTTIISAIVAFLTSIVNFFYVNDKVKKYEELTKYIYAQIIKYESDQNEYAQKKNKDFEIFHQVALKLGYESAKESEDARD